MSEDKQMRIKLKPLALTLSIFAFLMAFVSLLAYADAKDEIYFTAVNDDILPLDDKTMPVIRDGKCYLPYTILDNEQLGLFYSRNLNNYTLTIYSSGLSLTFDSPKGYAYDKSKTYDEKLIGKNGTVYIPIEFVCNYFNLNFQYIDISPAPVIRITTGNGSTESDFKANKQSEIANMYIRFHSQSASPAPTETWVSSPSPSYSPVITASPTPVPEPVRVYITFDDGPNIHTIDILDTLDDYELRATFFLTGSLIEDETRQDIVRRIYGSGHTIGIHTYSHKNELMYASPESLISEMERANEALDSVIGGKSRLFRFPYGSTHNTITSDMRESVINEGYRYWDWTIDAKDYDQTSGNALAEKVVTGLRSTEPGRSAVILMHDTKTTAEALPIILEHIVGGNYIVDIITPTKTPINFQKDTR